LFVITTAYDFPDRHYLEKPPVALKIRFLIIPGALFVLSLICLAVISGQHPQYISRILYIITFGSSTWLCASTQLRFKNNLATFCVAIGLILTALIAAGILSPKEAADYIKGLKEK
jgi:hypothetical protein